MEIFNSATKLSILPGLIQPCFLFLRIKGQSLKKGEIFCDTSLGMWDRNAAMKGDFQSQTLRQQGSKAVRYINKAVR